MTAFVTTGWLWPCDEGCAPFGNVIILVAEDGAADTIVPRLMAAGADLSRVHIVTAVRDNNKVHRAFNLQSDLDLLAAKIHEIGDVRLVLIDPISSYLGPKIDSHNNATVRAVLQPVGEMAERLQVAVVAVTHPPKCLATTAINRFIGSIAFVAVPRAAFMVTRDPEDESRRLLLPVKNNLAPLGKGFAFRIKQQIVGEPSKRITTSAIDWEHSYVDWSADDALRATDRGGANKASQGNEAEEFLRTILANGAVPVETIEEEAKSACIAWRTINRAKHKLRIRSEKSSMKGGWVWTFPKDARNVEGCHP